MSSVRLTISSRSPGESGHGILDLMGVVACVGPNKFQPWKALADLVEDEDRAIAVLNASRMDDPMQRQAFDINEGVYLVALHLLAGVVAHCVLFTPARGSPLSAAFSDWLSMIAAVGPASRSSASRSAT